MNNINIFEVATRNKFRFNFKGLASVEDLWDLSIRDLDSIFKVLNSQVKQSKEESLLDVKSEEDEILNTKIEIVKYIVKIKQNERDLRLQEKSKKEQKQKLMSILSEKQESELRDKSVDEIQRMLNELDS